MSELIVSFTKLKSYIEQQGGYDLELSGKDRLTLTFVPAFPEALEKSWQNNSAPRVIMHGIVNQGKVTFVRIQVEENNGLVDKDQDVAVLTYKDWLQYIEDSY